MATQTEIVNRVRNIAEQIKSGKKKTEIINDCTGQWEISGRTVERYIALAQKELIQKMEEEKINKEAKCMIEIIEKSRFRKRNPELEEILNKYKKCQKVP
jgi:hypothetical protein